MSSEFATLVQRVQSLEKGQGQTLVGRIGVRRKDRAEPWFRVRRETGSFLRTPKFLRVRSLENGLGWTLVRQVRSSEKGKFLSPDPNSEPGFGQVLSLFKKKKKKRKMKLKKKKRELKRKKYIRKIKKKTKMKKKKKKKIEKRIKEKKGQKGSFSELQTWRTRVRPVPFSQLRIRVRPGSFSELRTQLRIRVRPGSFSEPRTCRTSVRPVPFSELRTCQTRVQPCLFSELRTGRTRVRPIPFIELPACRTRVRPDPSSEFWTGTPNQDSAQSFLQTPNWNSEFRVKTQSWTKLAFPSVDVRLKLIMQAFEPRSDCLWFTMLTSMIKVVWSSL